jgi:CheY-like chemotaxis protein
MAKEILIADADKSDQKEFQRIFGTTDYHLIFSESGEDALLRAKLFKPDLIIASGTGLEEKGGMELCGAIKGDPDFKYTPFILISGIFDEISEKDRKQLQADGVISKPLNEAEVLDLVGNLMEEGMAGKRGEMVSEKEGFSLGEMGEEEEEIIELMDVVEEPEPRMSIDSFVPTGKEKSLGEVTSMDSWGKPEFEEETVEKELKLRPEKKTAGMDLRSKRKAPLEEASPEEELFDKIELEEILKKVEHFKPALEGEWPAEKEVRDIEESPFQKEEPADQLDLSEFEKALRREVKTWEPQEEPQPFFEEPKKKTSEETFFLEELEEKPFEKPLEKVLEKPLGEPFEELQEESLEIPFDESPEKLTEEALERPAEKAVEEPVELEEFEELTEEEFPEELLEDLLEEEETGATGESKDVEAEELSFEELNIEGIEEIEELEKMEEIEEPEKITAVEHTDLIEEMEPLEEVEEIKTRRVEEGAAPEMIRVETPKTVQVEVPKIPLEEVPSLAGEVDKRMQEAISQKIQEIMGEIMTKLVPEMTQSVIGFTLERIEKIVKDVVPDLAEKAIQEEIKRLEKGEKE